MYRIVFFIELNRLAAGESGTFSSFFSFCFSVSFFLVFKVNNSFSYNYL